MRHWIKKLFRRTRIFRNRASAGAENKIPKGTFCNSLVIKNAEEGQKQKYIPIGTFPLHPDGPHEITADKLAEMLENQAGDLMIDLGHSSLWDSGAPAYGWISRDSLEVREDGLYGDYPQWTPDAEELVANRKYRYLSPAYELEAMNKQGHDIGARLWPVALTNTPYFDQEIDALRNSRATKPSKESKMEINAETLKKLGLSEDATEEQINGKLDELVKAAEKIANPGTEEPEEKPEEKPEEQPEGAGKVEALLNSVIARLGKIEKDSADEKEAGRKARAEALVNSAIDNRQIKPAEKQTYLNDALSDFEGAKKRIEAIPKNSVKPERVALPEKGKSDSGTQSAVVSNSDLREAFSEHIRSKRLAIA